MVDGIAGMTGHNEDRPIPNVQPKVQHGNENRQDKSKGKYDALSWNNGEGDVCAAVCGALVVEDSEVGAECRVMEEDRERRKAGPT